MSRVRLALVGFGKWGRNYLRAAEESGEAHVTQIVLRGTSRARADAKTTGIPIVERVEQIDADAVVLAVHPREAPWLARVFLEICDLPVMIEKPAGLSLEDAGVIYAAEEKSKRLVLVAHQHLFAERYEELVKIRSGSDRVHVDTIFDGPVDRDYPALWDYGPHAAACALALSGAALELTAHPTSGLAPGASMLSWKGVWGTAACHVRFYAKKRRAIVRLNSEHEYDGYAPAEPALTRAVRAFARAVRAGGTDDWRFGASWATRVALILQAASTP